MYTWWSWFFRSPTFLLTKILREGNLFVKKVPTTANSALIQFNMRPCKNNGNCTKSELEFLLTSFDIHWTALVFKKYLKNQNNITRNFILSLNRVTRLENWKLSQKIGRENPLCSIYRKSGKGCPSLTWVWCILCLKYV